MEAGRIEELLDFDDLHVLVIGDIMLDEYLIGNTTRISPEAPVPIVNLDKKVHRLGGAANVAMNTSSLGAQTSLIGIIGNDENGEIIAKLTNEKERLKAYLVKDFTRRTTSKTRVLVANQNLLRIDNEDVFDVDKEIVSKVENMLKFIHHQKSIDIIILQDYNKGLFSPAMIKMVMTWLKKNKVKSALDPKIHNIELFKGVDIFKPNLKELRQFLGGQIEITSEALRKAGRNALKKMACDALVLTLSADGVYLINEESDHWESTSIQSIVDVSGAGDTVISVVALLYAKSEASLDEIGKLSNYAGAAVCSVPGVGVVDKSMVLSVVKSVS